MILGGDAFSRNLRITAIWFGSILLYYNFCRVHQTLRVAPAMEAGLTNHVWSLEELVRRLEQRTEKVAA